MCSLRYVMVLQSKFIDIIIFKNKIKYMNALHIFSFEPKLLKKKKLLSKIFPNLIFNHTLISFTNKIFFKLCQH